MHHISAGRLGLAIMTIGCAFCLVRGDRTLKIAAATLIINAYACEALEDWNGSHKAQPAILAIDCAFTLLLILIVWRTQTRWPQLALVANILIVATHIAALIGPHVTRWDFFSLYYALSYALLAALVYGGLAEAPPRRTRAAF